MSQLLSFRGAYPSKSTIYKARQKDEAEHSSCESAGNNVPAHPCVSDQSLWNLIKEMLYLRRTRFPLEYKP